MIRIPCPFCGERDHSEFAYGKDASVQYPPLDAPLEDWHEAVFLRDNIRGVQLETWQHLHGCRQWLVVERDTATHHIHSVRAAHPGVAAVLAGAGNDAGSGK
ncbi:MAG: sarcosine oxidase subunit delta [Gammaproteobacteria bacterium]|nr:sarcosine oxidase subunit delta [Gammaproteobacteria bacterium]